MQFMWLHTRFKEQTSIWVSNDIKVFLRIFMESVKKKRVIFQNGYLATFNARLLQQTRTSYVRDKKIILSKRLVVLI